MDEIDTVDNIHTHPNNSNKTSNTLICWEYLTNIPEDFAKNGNGSDHDKMNYALLACIQEVDCELIKVKSWNRTILKIQHNNPQLLASIKRSMHKQFQYVNYRSIPNYNNKNNKSNPRTINNAEHYSEHKYQSKITPMDYSDSSNNENDNYSADEESTNEDYIPTEKQTKQAKKKKSPKQIKKERNMRQQKKDSNIHSNDNNNQHHNQRQSESSQRLKSPSKSPKSNESEREQKAFEIQYNNPVIAPPPNPSTSNSDDKIYNKFNHHSPIKPSSPKPHFNFEYNNKNNSNKKSEQKQVEKVEEKKMDRPNLPKFDFGTGITYGNVVNISTSSEDLEVINRYENNPEFNNPNTFFHKPPSFNNVEFGKKFYHYKPKKKYHTNNNENVSNISNANAPQPRPQSRPIPRVQPQPQPQPQPPQIKVNKRERRGPPVGNLFEDTPQTNEGYLDYHTKSMEIYSEKIKKSSKREKNMKNYFLLSILQVLDKDYKIGNKIGKKDYGFHSDTGIGINGKLRGRDSNKSYGVDYKTDNEKDEKKEEKKDENGKRNSSMVLGEVMQACKFQIGIDFRWQEINNLNELKRGFTFGYKFILKQKPIGMGFGNKKTKAKADCADDTLRYLGNIDKYRDTVIRKQAGIKGSGIKNDAPKGYEYPINSRLMKNAKYAYNRIGTNQAYEICLIPFSGGYNANIQRHRLEIHDDRERNERENKINNPNVEDIYTKEWEQFKGENNIPKHCHQYLHPNGRFRKIFDNQNEKDLWKAIWKFYKPKFGNGNNQKYESNSNKSQNNNGRNKYRNNNMSNNSMNHTMHNTMHNNMNNTMNNNMNNNMNNSMQNNNSNGWKHFVIYDFDGTIYSERLYRNLVKKTHKPTDQMTNEEIKNEWKLERINPLKNHFSELKKYSDCGLCVVLHTFHNIENLEVLFHAINLDINNCFNIIMASGHTIIGKAKGNRSHGYSKNDMIKIFCEEYNVNYGNILYIDDDPDIKKDVQLCEVIMTKERNGINEQEMKDIEYRIVSKFGYNNNSNNNNNYNENNSNISHHSHHSHHSQSFNSYHSQSNNNNNNNRQQQITYETCMACSQSYEKNKMHWAENSFWLCNSCFYGNKDQARMDTGRPNQYQNYNSNRQ